MSYTPTTWKNDKTTPINSTNLNKMEQGIKEAHDAMPTEGTGYVKYPNGTLVCYGRKNIGTVAITTAWGGLYTHGSAGIALDNFPVPFVSTPVVTKTISGASGACSLLYSGTPSTTNPGNVGLMRGTDGTLNSVTIDYVAVGRWK